MTVITHRKLSGRAWAVSPATASPGTALTGVTFIQAAPAHPLMAYQASIGYLTPIGGIGPYRFAITDDQGSKYSVEWNTGRIYGEYNALGTTTDDLIGTCQDGRGTLITFNIPVAKRADSNPAIYFNDRPSVTAAISGNPQLNSFCQWHVQAFGGAHGSGDALTVTDPTGNFINYYGNVSTQSSGLPAPGRYPITLTLTATDSTTLTISPTITILPSAASTIEFIPMAVSTATPVGTVIGRLRATTPFNSPGWSILDPSGTLLVDPIKGDVTVMQAPSAGNLSIGLGVADGTATGSLNVNVSVPPGSVLASSAMTMSVAPGLINAGRGQSIGTPVIAGHIGGTWACVDLTGFNPNAELGYYGCPRRIVQDPVTGAITAPGLLSEETIRLQVTWLSTDGATSCVNTFSVPVTRAPTVTYYVGAGMSALHGANGFEDIGAARFFCNTNSGRTTFFDFQVYANADPNYYTGTKLVNDYYHSWPGPGRIVGVAANGVAQPRAGNTIGSAQYGGDWTGKGPFVFGDGDWTFENMEVSFVNGSGLTDGLEAVRKDGQTYGNLTLLNCNIHDCNNGLETGVCHGNIVVTGCEFANCGTSHTSAGNDHNLYVGSVSSLTVTNTVSRRATLGHMLKSRAALTTIDGCSFLATTGGQEGVPVEFPNAGICIVRNSFVQKAVMAQNPHSILWCAERDFGVPGALPVDEFPWTNNTLTVDNCQIDVMMMGGAHLGQPTGVAYYRCQDPFGRWMPPPTVANTSMWLSTGASRTWTMAGLGNQTPDTTPAHQVVEVNGTTRPLPFVPQTARPFLTGTLPIMGSFRWSGQWGGDSYQNFDSGQHVQSVNDVQISHTTASGTALLTLSATNGAFNQLTTANPFVAGTAWSLPTTGIYYPEAAHAAFAPAAAFTISTNSDGTGTLSVGTGLSPGTLYYVQARATAPNSTLADYRYAITVS